MKNLNNKTKNDTSLIIAMLIGIGIICIVALLTISSLLPNQSGQTIFGNKNESNNLPNIFNQLNNQGELKTFSSYTELSRYLENNIASQNYYTDDIRTLSFDGIAEAIPMTTDQKTGLGGGGGNNYSQTNIQVNGVDEADIIKTDGQYIYTVSEGNIFIIDANPGPDTKIISTIKLNDQPEDIYINNDKLIVFGYNYSLFNNTKVANILPNSQYTFLHIYDITDKTNPELIKKLDFEGYYSNSRMIGDYLYFLTNTWPTDYTIWPFPRLLDNDMDVCTSDIPNGTTCPNVYYFNIPYPSQQMTTVSAINIADTEQDVIRNVYILESSQNIYVSEHALYLTATKYLNEFQLTTEVLLNIVENNLSNTAKNKIVKIQQTDNEVLSDNEKIQKINQIVQSYILSLDLNDQDVLENKVQETLKHRYQEIKSELEKTIIYKIAIDKNSMEIVANGAVSGTVLNQFSMDEYNGFFRIATTNNQHWFPWTTDENDIQQSANNLYILDENLQPAGSLTNIAPDETIYSVRFMKDRAYMVTFEQIDPLFVIDTSDPYNPNILGTLKIPGFSNYLHPYDDHTIIGVGQDTYTDEFNRVRTDGVKISLFDVTDVANPREIDHYTVNEQSSTQAQYDHKAFLFSKDKNLLVLPINTWSSYKPFNGVLVFNITVDGISRRGAIEHTDVKLPQAQWQNQITRSLYIDDYLYTLSNAELKVNDLENLDDVTFVTLLSENNNYYPIYPIEPIPLDDIMIMEGSNNGNTDIEDDMNMMEINTNVIEETL